MTTSGANNREDLVQRSALVKREFAKLRAAKRFNRIRRRVIVTLIILGLGSMSVYGARDMQSEEYRLWLQYEAQMADVTRHGMTLTDMPDIISQLNREALGQAGLVTPAGDGAFSAKWWLTRTRLRTMRRDLKDDLIGAIVLKLELKLAEIYDIGMSLSNRALDSAEKRDVLETLARKIPEASQLSLQATAALAEKRGKLTQAVMEHRRLMNEADVNLWLNSIAPFFILAIYWVFSVRAANREKLEDRLRSTQAHLDLALRDLDGSQEELVERERKRLLGEVTESLAHELRNVLMPITAMSELMLEEEKLTDKQRRWTEVARICCTDAAVILANMKQFLTVVGQPAKHESIDLVALVKQVVEFTKPKWQSEAQRRGVNLRLTLKLPATLTVSGVDTELRQVITNLLMNAIESMTRSGEIRIELLRDGTDAVLTIIDQGLGLSDSSFRAEGLGSERSKSLGTGIGLHVSREIVMAYRGSIDFFTADGVGTTCEVRLPVETSRRRRVDQRHPIQSFQGISALCIDDNTMVLESLAALLRSLKAKVIVADSFSVATEVASNGGFDIVFCDLSLGSDNGLDLLQRLKEASPQLVTVLITGWNHFEPGLHPFTPDFALTKPIAREQLQRCLELCKGANRINRVEA